MAFRAPGGARTLDELTDVTLTAPTNLQPLLFDAASGQWIDGAVFPGAGAGIRTIEFAGFYYMPQFVAVTGAASAFALDRITVVPFFANGTYDRIGVTVTASVLGQLCRLGIYRNGANGRPAALVVDAGTVAANPVGFKEIVINQTFNQEIIWLAYIPEVGAPTVTEVGLPASDSIFPMDSMDAVGGTPPHISSRVGYVAIGISGNPLPTPYPAIDAVRQSNPNIWLRKA